MIIRAAPLDLSTSFARSLFRPAPIYPSYTSPLSLSIPPRYSSFSSREFSLDDRFESNSYSLERYFLSLIVRVKVFFQEIFSQQKKKRKSTGEKNWRFCDEKRGAEREMGETVPLKSLFDSSRFITIDPRSFLKCPLKAVQMLWMGSPTHWPIFFSYAYYVFAGIAALAYLQFWIGQWDERIKRGLKIILFFTRRYLENRKAYRDNSKRVSKWKVRRF